MNRNREDAALVGRGPDPAGTGEDGAVPSCLAGPRSCCSMDRGVLVGPRLQHALGASAIPTVLSPSCEAVGAALRTSGTAC
ncbi:small membrane A-kinase anchor protein isoform X3 [Lathamus discolor]|uniref:small membrane A-kinase anchor protein isoform X3 n=1 Tax=Lathamus discolor TaxID=678569 RepID=UPI0032B71211